MATISIEIPNAQFNRVINAIASLRGYQDEIFDIDGNPQPNSETRAQFARRQIVEFVIEHVRTFEARRDQKTARESAIDAVNREVTIT